MYLKLKKLAEDRQQNSTHDSGAQLLRISRTFAIVLVVFYVCYLPATILYTIHVYYLYARKNINFGAYQISSTVTTFLFVSNSSLNPVIYSKVHVKIYNIFKLLKVNCLNKLRCKDDRTTPQPIDTTNIVQLQVRLPENHGLENAFIIQEDNEKRSTYTTSM